MEEFSVSASDSEESDKSFEESDKSSVVSSTHGEKKDEVAIEFKKKVLNVLEGAKCKSSDFAISKELKTAPILVIDIEGIGKVHFPLYEEEAKTVVERFAQSPFGKKAETVIDVTVRNSKQLEPHSFKIINNQWESFLKQEILTTIADEMFIKTPFKASLYKLLLYEPGSFFKPHRDTEKEEGMFGTLIVQLPSMYAGGDLLIKHEEKSKSFNFSSIGHSVSDREFKMFFAAFYCDCQHEVLPITEGYRTCLVYNLVSTQSGEIPMVPKYNELETQLFDVTKNWHKGRPSKIVYALSHKYTESSLSFANLKGTDRSVVAFLKYCAEKCSLRMFLGLFMKHEFGGADGPEDCYSVIDPELDYSLKKLICVKSGESIRSGELIVHYGSEVIPSGVFKDLDPDKEEYQEYTGNEGASVDRWYNGAAVVFWLDDHTKDVLDEAGASHRFITEFYLNAYETFTAQSGNAGLDKVLELLDLVIRGGSSFENPDQASRVLFTVTALDKLPLLTQLLDKFNFFAEKSIPTLVEQCTKHGWKSLGPSIIKMVEKCRDWDKVVENMDLMIPESCCSDPDKRDVLQKCLTVILANLEKPSPLSLFSWYMAPLSAYLHANKQNSDQKFYLQVYFLAKKLNFEMSEYVKTNPILHAEVLLQLSKTEELPSHSVWLSAGVQCTESLQSIVSQTLSTPDLARSETWSCSCTDCLKLKVFLKSNRKQETFKVAKQRRLHLHQRMNNMVDLTHQTERVGSPQTLVVTKTQDSFDKKVIKREQAASLLPKLKAALNSGLESESKPSKIIKLEEI